jgi:hypothetical protein
VPARERRRRAGRRSAVTLTSGLFSQRVALRSPPARSAALRPLSSRAPGTRSRLPGNPRRICRANSCRPVRVCAPRRGVHKRLARLRSTRCPIRPRASTSSSSGWNLPAIPWGGNRSSARRLLQPATRVVPFLDVRGARRRSGSSPWPRRRPRTATTSHVPAVRSGRHPGTGPPRP